MTNSELQSLLILHSVEGLGPARIKRLFDYFGSFEGIWNSSISEFSRFKFPDKLISNFKEAKKSLDPEKYFLDLEKTGIKVITIFDEEYPERLREISGAPMIIYY